MIGAVVIAATPRLVRRVAQGLARDLDLPTERAAAQVLPVSAGDEAP